MKKLKKRSLRAVATVALLVTSAMVNSGCLLFMYQPELPEGAEDLYKK